MSATVLWTSNIELVSSFFSAALGNSFETRSGVVGDVAYIEVFNASGNGNFLILEYAQEISEQRVLLSVDNVESLFDRFVNSEIAMGDKFYTVGGLMSVMCTLPGNINLFLVQYSTKDNRNIDQSRVATQGYLEWLAKGEVKEAAKTAAESPAAAATPVWKSPVGTPLPSIRPRIFHNGVFRSMHVNTTHPVPFSNALFEGQVLLIVNTAVETKETYTSLFKKNKYKFELQVQGKFKSVPAGPIFFGGEITKKMELGMVTRGICAGILQIGRTMNAYLHHSFGDNNNTELPHIVGPFWSSVDRLVVTPSGDKAPDFFQSFPEESKARTARKANPEYTVSVNLDSTYSFSMKTGSMDLEEWAIVPSSFSRSMSLNTFWADADLRFVCYCIPAAAEGVVYTAQGLPKTHPQAQLQHFFSLEVQHAANHPEWAAGTTEGPDSPHQRLGNDHSRHRTVSNMTEQDLFQSYESVSLTTGSATSSAAEAAEGVSADDGLRESLTSDADSDEFYDAVEGDLVGEGGAVASRPGAHACIAEEDEGLPDISAGESTPMTLRSSEVSIREDASEGASVDGDVLPSATDLRTRAQASLAECDAAAETERVTALLSDKLALLQDRILSHSTAHLTHQPSPSRRPPRPPQIPQADVSIASTMLKRSLIVAILDIDDHRRMKRGKRRTMYAFLSNHSDLREDFTISGSSSGARCARRYVLHSYGEWKEQLELVKLPTQPPNYARYADDMKRKTALSWSYECILKGSHHGHLRSKLADFLSDMTHNTSFLTPNPHGVGSKKLRVSLPPFTMESMVCVQQGNFSWSEECMGLSAEELIFVKPSKRLGTGVRLRIPVRDVLAARKVSEADNPLPLPGFYCLLVCTFAKQYTVLLRGQEERDAWVSALQSQSFHQSSGRSTTAEPSATESVSAGAPSSLPGLRRTSTMDNATGVRLSGSNFSFSLSSSPASYLEGLVVYPPDWNLQDRMILNGRNFTCGGFYHQLNLRTLELGRLINDPCRLVEQLLDMAFRLAQIATADDTALGQTIAESNAQSARPLSVSWNTTSSVGVYLGEDSTATSSSGTAALPSDPEQLWIDFLDGVSLLQCIDLSIVDNTSPEAACLFMNLYHCLLLHAYMVVGLPNSLFKWSHFFRFCSYEAFGDIFSLAELEHCIMRSGMARPNINFLAQHFLIPHLQYSFALQVRDYRLLWGIFCGATSNVSEIPIYTPELLDMQLNSIVSASLMSEVKVAGNRVTLPVACQLYAKEFEPSGQTAAPSKAVLRVLLPYLSGELKDSVEALINQPGSFSVRYTPFNFQCRYPTRLQESSLLLSQEETEG